jgi:hypothetical protein
MIEDDFLFAHIQMHRQDCFLLNPQYSLYLRHHVYFCVQEELEDLRFSCKVHHAKNMHVVPRMVKVYDPIMSLSVP